MPGAVPPTTGAIPSQEVSKVLARVGKEAIDFKANAFTAGVGFQPVKLSDYKVNGLSCASIPVTLPLSDQPNWQRLLPATKNSRRWE